MNNILHIKISDNSYIYGNFLISEFSVEEKVARSFLFRRKIIKLDSVFVHYLVKELNLCDFYRKCFITKWTNSLKIVLKPTQCDLIDYLWNERVYCLVRAKCELDHALSWLSTLGGAFSALGKEYHYNY